MQKAEICYSKWGSEAKVAQMSKQIEESMGSFLQG
jgi:hypothetical protein